MAAGGLGRFAAIDLGASSGRVMAATVSADEIQLREVHRFANQPVSVAGTLHWDVLSLYRESLTGLRLARAQLGRLDSIGIDSWAIDYGLLDADGRLIGNPVHYRDSRTRGIAGQVMATVSAEVLYAETGIQLLPFNTIFQLVAAAGTAALGSAHQLLLIPDLLGYWLTGMPGAEFTNASTTQLIGPGGDWSKLLFEKLKLPLHLMPAIRQPGDVIGRLTAEAQVQTGLGDDARLVAVGSHDTASAVVGVPAESPNFAYISCGTWSLVGMELDQPVLTEASRQANFSNEAGVDGTVRYLRNVMGLWLLQESLRTWGHSESDLTALLAQAGRLPAGGSLINPDDSRFLQPGDMPSRIAAYCGETGQSQPGSHAEFVRCILDSLALAYRRYVRLAAELSGRTIEVVHLVGGGTHNGLLCQLAADAIGLPVIAGPVEAAALGNVLVQARTAGIVGGGLPELRALLRRAQVLQRYEPQPAGGFWPDAEEMIFLR